MILPRPDFSPASTSSNLHRNIGSVVEIFGFDDSYRETCDFVRIFFGRFHLPLNREGLFLVGIKLNHPVTSPTNQRVARALLEERGNIVVARTGGEDGK